VRTSVSPEADVGDGALPRNVMDVAANARTITAPHHRIDVRITAPPEALRKLQEEATEWAWRRMLYGRLIEGQAWNLHPDAGIQANV